MNESRLKSRWTREAALAFIEARPGDQDADAIIRDLAAEIERLLSLLGRWCDKPIAHEDFGLRSATREALGA